MRWSELSEKEMIDIAGGERIGNVGQADLVVDLVTGRIEAFIMPVGASWFGRPKGVRTIEWRHVRKIGPEMMIVESAGSLNPYKQRGYR